MKNKHFSRLGTNRATVKGSSEHMLTPEGGGIAERPLTARIRTISGVAGTSFDVPAAAYDGESWGSGGIAPGSTGAGLKVLLGVGKAHGFSGLPPALIKRKLPPCGRQLPLNPLYGNIPVKVGSYFLDKSRKSPPYP